MTRVQSLSPKSWPACEVLCFLLPMRSNLARPAALLIPRLAPSRDSLRVRPGSASSWSSSSRFLPLLHQRKRPGDDRGRTRERLSSDPGTFVPGAVAHHRLLLWSLPPQHRPRHPPQAPAQALGCHLEAVHQYHPSPPPHLHPLPPEIVGSSLPRLCLPQLRRAGVALGSPPPSYPLPNQSNNGTASSMSRVDATSLPLACPRPRLLSSPSRGPLLPILNLTRHRWRLSRTVTRGPPATPASPLHCSTMFPRVCRRVSPSWLGWQRGSNKPMLPRRCSALPRRVMVTDGRTGRSCMSMIERRVSRL